MKDILIISHFVDLPWENGNDRFCYIAELLAQNKASVEIVTSDFLHIQKKCREDAKLKLAKLPYLVTMIHEPGYKKNVSVKRIFSHKKLSTSLKQYLMCRKKPDLIYCAVPSLSLALEASVYAKKQRIPFIIDIQDLWPEMFEMVLPFKKVSKYFLLPFRLQADKLYASADAIVAVSNTYLKRGLRVNPKCKAGLCVYLGTDLERFDKYRECKQITKDANEIWIGYVGTLGHSYNLSDVIDSIALLNNRKIRLVVMGDGPLKEKFQRRAEEKKINAWFLGRIPYPLMVAYLCKCDIAVNPIMKGAAQSIINKVGDYAAAGLPVVSTQECEEYRNLIQKYHCGINCENGDKSALMQAFKSLYHCEEKRKTMGTQNRMLAEERFNRERTYRKICSLIFKLTEWN